MDSMESSSSPLLIDACPPRYESEFPTDHPLSLLSCNIRHRADDSYYGIYPTLLLHDSSGTCFSNESSRHLT
jgi:hypothetical protein